MKIKKAWFIPAGAGSTANRVNAIEDKEMDFDTMYPIIKCSTIEHVGLKKGVDMWCDEEGLLIDRPVCNIIATHLYRKAYPHVDPSELAIYGNVIITDNTKAGDFIQGN